MACQAHRVILWALFGFYCCDWVRTRPKIGRKGDVDGIDKAQVRLSTPRKKCRHLLAFCLAASNTAVLAVREFDLAMTARVYRATDEALHLSMEANIAKLSLMVLSKITWFLRSFKTIED